MRNFKQVFAGMTVAVLLTACASGEQKALTVSGLDPAKFDTRIYYVVHRISPSSGIKSIDYNICNRYLTFIGFRT